MSGMDIVIVGGVVLAGIVAGFVGAVLAQRFTRRREV